MSWMDAVSSSYSLIFQECLFNRDNYSVYVPESFCLWKWENFCAVQEYCFIIIIIIIAIGRERERKWRQMLLLLSCYGCCCGWWYTSLNLTQSWGVCIIRSIFLRLLGSPLSSGWCAKIHNKFSDSRGWHPKCSVAWHFDHGLIYSAGLAEERMSLARNRMNKSPGYETRL